MPGFDLIAGALGVILGAYAFVYDAGAWWMSVLAFAVAATIAVIKNSRLGEFLTNLISLYIRAAIALCMFLLLRSQSF